LNWNWKLETGNWQLLTANCQQQTSNFKLQTSNLKLQTANCKLQTATATVATDATATATTASTATATPTADLVCVMEEAGDRGVVEHVGHVLVQQLLAPRVAGVELHGVVPQLLQGSRKSL
jgi:hypothetical protein